LIATQRETTDRELVAAVRAGDDAAFEELYRRYRERIVAYVRRMVRDEARAEDLTQDAFISALRSLRATDSEIVFKPWIYEIARNATIDHWRRSNRAEEVSVDNEELLRPSDRARLVGSLAPDTAVIDKERLSHLSGAFDELSDVHSRILVMRELEGLSYREIGERLQLSRSSVESALFRARRRLEVEYAEVSAGRRCLAMRNVAARLSEGVSVGRDEHRLARHAYRCHSCRRLALEMGVQPVGPLDRLREKVAALLPFPFLLRRRGGGDAAGGITNLLPAGGPFGSALTERAAALLAAAAIVGAGGVVAGGEAVLEKDPERRALPGAVQQKAAPVQAGVAADEPVLTGDSVRRSAQADGRERRRPAEDSPAVPSDSGTGQKSSPTKQDQSGTPAESPAPTTVPEVEGPRLPAGGGDSLLGGGPVSETPTIDPPRLDTLAEAPASLPQVDTQAELPGVSVEEVVGGVEEVVGGVEDVVGVGGG
jgi:RNA polymerase sigma factor (sigma-70 family)